MEGIFVDQPKVRPACFNSTTQWSSWLEANTALPVGMGGYCEDCTSTYQRAMISQQRCAYPGVTFISPVGEPPDGLAVEGRRPTKLEDWRWRWPSRAKHKEVVDGV